MKKIIGLIISVLLVFVSCDVNNLVSDTTKDANATSAANILHVANVMNADYFGFTTSKAVSNRGELYVNTTARALATTGDNIIDYRILNADYYIMETSNNGYLLVNTMTGDAVDIESVLLSYLGETANPGFLFHQALFIDGYAWFGVNTTLLKVKINSVDDLEITRINDAAHPGFVSKASTLITTLHYMVKGTDIIIWSGDADAYGTDGPNDSYIWEYNNGVFAGEPTEYNGAGFNYADPVFVDGNLIAIESGNKITYDVIKTFDWSTNPWEGTSRKPFTGYNPSGFYTPTYFDSSTQRYINRTSTLEYFVRDTMFEGIRDNRIYRADDTDRWYIATDDSDNVYAYHIYADGNGSLTGYDTIAVTFPNGVMNDGSGNFYNSWIHTDGSLYVAAGTTIKRYVGTTSVSTILTAEGTIGKFAVQPDDSVYYQLVGSSTWYDESNAVYTGNVIIK